MKVCVCRMCVWEHSMGAESLSRLDSLFKKMLQQTHVGARALRLNLLWVGWRFSNMTSLLLCHHFGVNTVWWNILDARNKFFVSFLNVLPHKAPARSSLMAVCCTFPLTSMNLDSQIPQLQWPWLLYLHYIMTKINVVPQGIKVSVKDCEYY